jgi:replicative DNA helicase
MPAILDDQGGLTLFDVASKARSVKRQHGLSLLVIDYLQLMSGEGDNRNQQIDGMTRGLKALAKELAVPIIVLSQLSRKCEERTNRRPMSSDLRDSGAIEQDADVILFVYRDEIYNEHSPDKGTAEIWVAKNRQGPTGLVRLAYQGCYTRFDNLAASWQPDPSADPAPKKRRGMDAF